MGYRELHRMEIEEVVRRWQAQQSQRAIARATGLARETVKKYLAAAISLGLSATGPPPNEEMLIELQRLGIVAVQPVRRVAPQVAMLEPYREQIGTWLGQDQLLLTRIQELLAGQGVAATYTTLRRYVRQAGLWKQPRSTVRMAPTAPGEVAEMDFGKLGTLINPVTGKRQVIYGLLVVLVYSRHAFVWPLLQQTVEATIEGLEEAWRFFGGLPVRLVLDKPQTAEPDVREQRVRAESYFRRYCLVPTFAQVGCARLSPRPGHPTIRGGVPLGDARRTGSDLPQRRFGTRARITRTRSHHYRRLVRAGSPGAHGGWVQRLPHEPRCSWRNTDRLLSMASKPAVAHASRSARQLEWMLAPDGQLPLEEAEWQLVSPLAIACRRCTSRATTSHSR
jgi:transposase